MFALPAKLGEVKAYISRQEEHHRKLTYREEVVALLEKLTHMTPASPDHKPCSASITRFLPSRYRRPQLL
jgi:hypothetical protein